MGQEAFPTIRGPARKAVLPPAAMHLRMLLQGAPSGAPSGAEESVAACPPKASVDGVLDHLLLVVQAWWARAA